MKGPHLLLGLGILLLASCASQPNKGTNAQIPGASNPSFHILADRTHRLPRSGTFDWGMSYFQIDSDLKVDLAVLDERVHAALLHELSNKHFTLQKANPNYFVGYAVAAGDNIDEKSLNDAYGEDLKLPAKLRDSALKYKQGVLIVDIVNSRTKRLIWRGAITAGVDMDVTEEQKQQRIRAAIAQLLKHFPRV
jgi:hypothetical protein